MFLAQSITSLTYSKQGGSPPFSLAERVVQPQSQVNLTLAFASALVACIPWIRILPSSPSHPIPLRSLISTIYWTIAHGRMSS